MDSSAERLNEEVTREAGFSHDGVVALGRAERALSTWTFAFSLRSVETWVTREAVLRRVLPPFPFCICRNAYSRAERSKLEMASELGLSQPGTFADFISLFRTSSAARSLAESTATEAAALMLQGMM